MPLPPLAPGQTLELTVPVALSDIPKLWTAETPSLYTVQATLAGNGTLLMSARQRFGFRDVRIDGHRLLLNGVPLKLRGANFHISKPGSGESVPREFIARDLQLIADANINTLRSRPTPDRAYVELCDEMGFYTTVEAMFSLMIYDAGLEKDWGNNPALGPPFRLHAATMIESLYSHPSILTWGLGNECPYYDYFKFASLGMHQADPTRPLFFGSDNRLGVDIPFMDINDDHYPRDGVTTVDNPGQIVGKGWDYPDDRPNIFTEWLHVHTNNLKEIAYDPGIDDFWGYACTAHIEYLYNTPDYAGGFMFKAAPYRGVGVKFPWRGIFDDDRKLFDLAWHVKKSHSPIQIADRAGVLVNGTLTLPIENRYEFTNLKDVRFRFVQGDASGDVVVDVPPRSKGSIAVPFAHGAPLVLTAFDKSGRLIDQWQPAPAGERRGLEQLPRAVQWTLAETDAALTVTADNRTFVIDRASGLLTAASLDGQPVVTAAPTLIVLPSQLNRFRWQQKLTLVNQAVDWKADKVEIARGDNTLMVTATGAYQQMAGTFTTTIDAAGEVTIAYDFTATAGDNYNCFAWGLSVPVDPSRSTLTWDRRSQWTSYPPHHIGRPSGTARATLEGKNDPYVWSHELIDGVTRDFRSTRFFIHSAGLVDDAGKGVVAISDATQHLQAVPLHGDLDGTIFTAGLHGPRKPGFSMSIYKFHNGGTEPHLTKSLVFDTLRVAPGVKFADTVRLRLK
jgi:beta-galactosidase